MQARMNINDFNWYQHGDGSWTLTAKEKVNQNHINDMADCIILDGRTATRRFIKTEYGGEYLVGYWQENKRLKPSIVLNFLIVG